MKLGGPFERVVNLSKAIVIQGSSELMSSEA